MKRSTKKLVLASLFLAMGVLIPQLFHFTGVPQAGSVFLPMHIPVMIAGFMLGPEYGLLLGALTPALSSLLTAMPPLARLPFMVGELMAYGFVCGLLFTRLKVCMKPVGQFTAYTYFCLIAAMLAGRIVYALMLLVAFNVLHIGQAGPYGAVAATVTGLPGIGIQLVLIPPLLMALKKGGYFHGLYVSEQSKEPASGE